jgi:hypothetical protein
VRVGAADELLSRFSGLAAVTELSLPENRHPVGDFGANGQDEAFGEAGLPRAAWRVLIK